MMTIGMCVYDDFDGVYFTIQSLRLHHKDILDKLQFVIINNNPNSKSGEAVNNLARWIAQPTKVVNFTDYSSTSLRNLIFDHADTPYVISTDCHCLFDTESIRKVYEYFDNGLDNGNLLQGPLVYDNMNNVSTHFDLQWRNYMWGIWGTDKRGESPNNDPFEIPAQGLGVFACRKDSWLRFNSRFRGFGGEEGYIHEKYRKSGRKTICLPFFRWLHRFDRPLGVPYKLDIIQRIQNYCIGFKELNLNVGDIRTHFVDEMKALTPQQFDRIVFES